MVVLNRTGLKNILISKKEILNLKFKTVPGVSRAASRGWYRAGRN